jgi:hypothetical protein
MAIQITETTSFDYAKTRVVEVFKDVSLGASGISSWSDDIMPYIISSEGFNTMQIIISGNGKVDVEATGAIFDSVYGAIFDSEGSDKSFVARGILAASSGRCVSLSLPILNKVKLRVKEVGNTSGVTISLYIAYKKS